jgi:hypothetical protein
MRCLRRKTPGSRWAHWSGWRSSDLPLAQPPHDCQAEHDDEGEVVPVGGLAGGEQQRLELQVR